MLVDPSGLQTSTFNFDTDRDRGVEDFKSILSEVMQAEKELKAQVEEFNEVTEMQRLFKETKRNMWSHKVLVGNIKR